MSSNYQEYKRDKYQEDKRYGDHRGRRDSGGGYDRSQGQACFYCKEVGHKISDCPKKSNKFQRNGSSNFRNNRNENNGFNKKVQKENFVYEDNCPPPEDEDWGGGADSEEEKKRLKKEQKKAKKLQQLQESQQEELNNQNEDNQNQEVNDPPQQQPDIKQKDDNDFEEDWGGKEEENIYVKQENLTDNQANVEMSIEDQINAQFGGSFVIHQSRNVQDLNDQNGSNESKTQKKQDSYENHKDNYDKGKDRNSSRERTRETERDRDQERERSRDRKYKSDKSSYSQKSYDRSSKYDDYKSKKDYERSKKDYDKPREYERRNSENDYKSRSDRDKYSKSDRNYNQEKSKSNGYSDRENSLRDHQYRIKQSRISEERDKEFLEKNQDSITLQIDQMLKGQLLGQNIMPQASKIEEEEQQNDRKDDDYEEWTLEKDNDKEQNNNRNYSYSNDYNDGGYSSRKKNNYEEDWGGSGDKRYDNKDDYNNSYQKKQYNNYNNRSNHSFNKYNREQYKKVPTPILIISDDENQNDNDNDPWALSPKRTVKNKLNTQKQHSNNTQVSSKNSLSNLVSGSLQANLIEESPVYEPNLNYEDQSTVKYKDPLLYYPDQETKQQSNEEKKYEGLGVENIFDFEELQKKQKLKVIQADCVKFYDKTPSQSFKLGYDRHSQFFKEKLQNFLYSEEGDCLKVFEGDLKIRRQTDKGSLSMTIKAQVYTNHSWNEVKWIPSLKVLKQKDRVKEFQSIDFSTGASQLSKLLPKENYDRVFYLFWIEGQNQEDEEKIEEYSNYLYEKKLLSGVNLDVGCFNMASINQIFPDVESFMRSSEFKKKTPIKLVLIYNPEQVNQISYKAVPF